MMGIDEVLAVARSCEVRNPGLNDLRLQTRVTGLDLEIMVSHWPPDRDTAEPVQISRRRRLHIHEINLRGKEWLISEIAHEVREMFVHEFQECFHVDGERYRDPHLNERT